MDYSSRWPPYSVTITFSECRSEFAHCPLHPAIEQIVTMCFRNPSHLFLFRSEECTSKRCAFWSSTSAWGTRWSSFFTFPKMAKFWETVEMLTSTTFMQLPVWSAMDLFQGCPSAQQDLWSRELLPWVHFWTLVSPGQNFANQCCKVLSLAVPLPKGVLMFLSALDTECPTLNS